MPQFTDDFIKEALEYYSGIIKKEIRMPYGDRKLSIQLPLETSILNHPATDLISLDESRKAVNDALDRPFGGETIEYLVKSNSKAPKNQKATVIVCDRTRPVPYHWEDQRGILKPVLERLVHSGLNCSNINILVALGTHSEQDKDNWVRDKFGDKVSNGGYKIVFHDCKADDLVSVGLVDTGHGNIEVRLNRLLIESDIIIPTASIESHFMAGASGGAKVLYPGCASGEAIVKGIHGPFQMTDKNTDFLIIDENPIQQTLWKTVEKLVKGYNPKILSLNVVMSGDCEYLMGVFAGGMKESHKAGVELVKSYAKSYIDNPVDIVISPAGPIASSNQYQSVKPLFAASRIMTEGGYAIIISPMHGGIGGKEGYAQSMRQLAAMGPEKYLAEVVKPGYKYELEEWQTVMCARALKGQKNVVWVTDNLSKEELKQLPGL